MRILIIEDNIKLCHFMTTYLQEEHYDVDNCYNGEDALLFLKQNAFDLIILDRMLPYIDGITVLKKIRELNIPSAVIIVTALDGIGDRVAGLDAGADDYLVKPFDMEELSARIRALSRRPKHIENLEELAYGDITLNLNKHILSGPQSTCVLSKREFQLMELFLKNPSQSLSRNIILSRIWGLDSDIEDGNLDNYIYFLRRRLKHIGSSLKIKTIYTFGYTLEAAHDL